MNSFFSFMSTKKYFFPFLAAGFCPPKISFCPKIMALPESGGLQPPYPQPPWLVRLWAANRSVHFVIPKNTTAIVETSIILQHSLFFQEFVFFIIVCFNLWIYWKSFSLCVCIQYSVFVQPNYFPRVNCRVSRVWPGWVGCEVWKWGRSGGTTALRVLSDGSFGVAITTPYSSAVLSSTVKHRILAAS